MLTAVVTSSLASRAVEVAFVRATDDEHADERAEESHAEESHVECEFELEEGETNEGYPCAEGPSPILPEMKELAWGGGSFVVLALAMRFFLYPRLRKGMDSRYARIDSLRAQAEAARPAAQAEVAAYEAKLAVVKAEAAGRVDAARATLESERAAKVAELQGRIDARRSEAVAQVEAAKQAAAGDVAAAVADVTGRTLELALGKAPDAAAVRSAVDAVTTVGATS